MSEETINRGQGSADDAFQDCYKILNLDKNASSGDIKKAYHSLKQTYHKGNEALYSLLDGDDVHHHLAAIEKAYQILIDLSRRVAHDRELLSRKLAKPEYLALQVRDVLAQRSEPGKVAEKVDVPVVTDAQEITASPAESHATNIQSFKLSLSARNASSPGIREKVAQILEGYEPLDGETLRKIREIVGVSLDEIQEQTKISRYNIDAIENNHFDRLPQLVYVKGLLRSYLRFLGVPDYDSVVQTYVTRLGEWKKLKKAQ